MSPLRLFLVRHGENRANLTGEFSHRRIDYALTGRGRLQARQTAARLCPIPFERIYSSPLRRALQTAHLIAAPHTLEPVPVEAFREIDVGCLENAPPTKQAWTLHDCLLRAWKQGFLRAAFPGGEDGRALLARFFCGLHQVLAESGKGPVLVVGHGGLFNIAAPRLCPQADPRLWARDLPNASISEVEIEGRTRPLRGRLRRWADISHLRGEAARFAEKPF